MEHSIIKVIAPYRVLSQQETADILSCFTCRQYKRNGVLMQAGEYAQHVFFVEKGALYQYYIDDNGHEHTCNFVFENEFITDLESFSKKQPATSSLKALEPSTCYFIKCEDLVNLIEVSPATDEFFRSVIENVAAEGIRRTRSLLSCSPEKSFLALLDDRPDIFQRVPQRYIAQYLGIAPESLSRIKKRLMLQEKS